jgi:two-component sensor histidine kinase
MARLDALYAASRLVRYALAAGAILAMILMRAAFDNALAPGAYYFLYYPAIVIIAYVLGLGPAIAAAVLAAVVPYYVFAEPVFQIKTELRPNVRVALFLLTSCAVAALIAEIRRRLGALTEQVSQTAALTRSQAELFREHAERVGNHLQLLSAILQFKAKDEGEADYARVLTNAASRTLLISRMHRSFASLDTQEVDFFAFAQRLSDAALEAHGRPPLAIRIEGELRLLPEQATSLALLLLECINARVKQHVRGAMHIALSRQAGEGVLVVTHDHQGADDLHRQDMDLLGAIAEQMQGRLVIGASGERGVLRFSFPTELQPLPKWDPIAPMN